MLLSQCVAATGGKLIHGDCEFKKLSTDTRKVASGELFVALRGKNFDAHAFVSAAIAAGACGLVVEHEIHEVPLPQLIVSDTTAALGAISTVKRDMFAGVLVAITGSSGKTSVKGMLSTVLARVGAVTATRGNYNNHIGVPLTLMTMADEDDYAVIEMGANGLGEIAYLAGLAKPQVALVNNVMPAHLEGFGSLRGVAEEKGQIYSHLSAVDNAVINLADDYANYFLSVTEGVHRWGFHLTTPSSQVPDDVRVVSAENIAEDAMGRPTFELVFEGQHQPAALSVVGRHNVANALAAATCALAAGVSLQEIARGLEQFAGEPGRMQVGKAANGAMIVNDTYNANPGSVRAAIDYLSARDAERILVLGDLAELGATGADALAELGRYARDKGISTLLTCGDIARNASAAFGAGAEHFETQEQLVTFLIKNIPSEAVALVKGSRSARMENVVTALNQSGESK